VVLVEQGPDCVDPIEREDIDDTQPRDERVAELRISARRLIACIFTYQRSSSPRRSRWPYSHFLFPHTAKPANRRKGKHWLKMLSGMVFVKGGTFMMGDFGVEVSPEKLAYTSQHENKPAHQVMLDTFSISKYKITFH
jgi:formylglycine-generating enzyme required for sulfatase activity